MLYNFALVFLIQFSNSKHFVFPLFIRYIVLGSKLFIIPLLYAFYKYKLGHPYWNRHVI